MNEELSNVELRHYRRYNSHGESYGECCETCAFIKEVKRLEDKLLQVTEAFALYEEDIKLNGG